MRVAGGPSGMYNMGVGGVGGFPICFPYYFSDFGGFLWYSIVMKKYP